MMHICVPYMMPMAVVHHKDAIFVERFNTKPCEKFATADGCQYGSRCMFAHGCEELRTKAMNIRDNLTTEAAVKEFQRERAIAARASRKQLARKLKRVEHKREGRRVQSVTDSCRLPEFTSDSDDLSEEPLALFESQSMSSEDGITPTSGVSRVDRFTSPDVHYNQPRSLAGRWRHNPYSFVSSVVLVSR